MQLYVLLHMQLWTPHSLFFWGRGGRLSVQYCFTWPSHSCKMPNNLYHRPWAHASLKWVNSCPRSTSTIQLLTTLPGWRLLKIQWLFFTSIFPTFDARIICMILFIFVRDRKKKCQLFLLCCSCYGFQLQLWVPLLKKISKEWLINHKTAIWHGKPCQIMGHGQPFARDDLLSVASLCGQ